MTVSDAGAARPGRNARTPIHLWIVGIAALLWNAVGVFDYVATQIRYEPYMSQFTPEQLEYFYGFPAWVNVVWAVGLGTALFGSVALLLRKRWAVPMFGASLAAMAVTSVYTLVLTEGMAIMGTEGAVFSLIVWMVGILLLVYAWRQAHKGVLR